MFNPPITDLHSAFDDLSRLLAIIADPAAHRPGLDELVAQEKAASEQIAALNVMSDETRRLHLDAEAAAIVSDKRKAALDKREAEIEERAKKFDLDALQRREATLNSREEFLAREKERLTAMRTDLETRLEKIKNFRA
jgi:hypothetical protein